MDFITRSFRNSEAAVPAAARRFRLLWYRKSSLKRLFACVVSSALFCTVLPACAEGIRPERREAKLLPDGRLAVSSRFQTELPQQLADALGKGVPLDFVLRYRLEKPTLPAYRSKLGQLVGEDDTVGYRLSYHAITGRYRVSVGTFSSEYASLGTALKAVGAIAHWTVMDKGMLSDTQPADIKAQIRLSLRTAMLPKPFQTNAVNSENWQLDSGWHDLTVGK